ncbi:MAG TPA: hypothetical protein VH143_03935 [Kofleriaceae bacterium]|jgi:hypothetical protein|nr:hypothetical protein [Kofleriaceae bacterium]
MSREIVTSPDGQWFALRDGRDVTLVGPRVPASDDVQTNTYRWQLDGDDAELACVSGPPILLVAIVRTADATRISLFVPPETEAAARLELGARAHVAAVGGGRVALVTDDRKEMTLVRAAGRGLAPHPVELGDSSVDFAVALERNQLVIGQPRKLEVWDGVSGRPLRRLGLELPSPPRLVGAASGHLWVVRPGTDEIIMYRLSDGRPFRHYVGAPIDDVVASLASPLIVLVTRRGLVRLHCFAHSLFAVDAPWQSAEPMAQLVCGDDIALLGWPAGASEPWSVLIGGQTQPSAEPIAQDTTSTLATAGEKLRQMKGLQLNVGGAEVTTFVARAPSPSPPTAQTPDPAPTPTVTVSIDGTWRDHLAHFASRALAGDAVERPDPEAVAALASRLGLDARARGALALLYACYLVGEPAIAIARAARLLGDWTEALGSGRLHALAMLERTRGTVALHAAVTDVLDGAPPRHVRIAGGESEIAPRAGVWRINRDRRGDAEIESALVGSLARIAIVAGERDLVPGVLEARLRGATAVSMLPPGEPPRPWPDGAGLVLVIEHGRTASAWVADVPML